MSASVRPAKVYTWAPAWPSGRVLGWLLIAVGGLSVIDAPFEVVRAVSATSVTTTGLGARWSFASPIAFVAAPVAIACQILWLIWQHRATANLWARGILGVRFTPGWAVGWWFVPFAFWVQPFRAVRELSHDAGRAGSQPEPDATPAVSDGVLAAWWATYVGGQILALPVIVIALRTILPAISHATGTRMPTITYQASDLRAMSAWLCLAAVVRIASALLAARVVWSLSKAGDGAFDIAPVPPRPDL